MGYGIQQTNGQTIIILIVNYVPSLSSKEGSSITWRFLQLLGLASFSHSFGCCLSSHMSRRGRDFGKHLIGKPKHKLFNPLDQLESKSRKTHLGPASETGHVRGSQALFQVQLHFFCTFSHSYRGSRHLQFSPRSHSMHDFPPLISQMPVKNRRGTRHVVV